MPITAGPITPSMTRPATYAAEAEAWTDYIAGQHRLDLNALEANVVAKEAAAAVSAASAGGAATTAQASAGAAATSEAQAAASAASAVNAPGTAGTSATSATLGLGSKSLTTQAGKAWSVGQVVSIAVTGSPTVRMVGPITAYNSGTGALTVMVEQVFGSGTFAAWTIAIGASYSELPSRAGNAGKVPMVGADAASVAWEFADRAAPSPALFLGRAVNLALHSEAIDSNVSPWVLGGGMVRVGVTAGRAALTYCTIYSAPAGSAYVAQAITLPAPGWYTISVYARLILGSVPTQGGVLTVDHDPGGGIVKSQLTDWTGLSYVWRRFEMPFYAATTSVVVYTPSDWQTGAQIAVCDFMLNAGKKAATYAPTAGTTTSALPTPTQAVLTRGEILTPHWFASVSGGATITTLQNGVQTPDGRLATVFRETNAVAAGVVRFARATETLYLGVPYCVTILARADSLSTLLVLLSGGAYATTVSAFFNAATGAVGTLTGVQYAWTERVPGTDWMLCHVVFDPPTSTAATTVYVGVTSTWNVQTHATVVGAQMYFGGVQMTPGYEPRPFVSLSSTAAFPFGHADLQPRRIHHVDSSLGNLDLTLPPAIPDDWVDVVDVGRAAATNRIRLLRGAAPAIGGLPEDMDININGAAIRLRADATRGWVLA